jgi:hypothetical protein
VLVYKDSAIQLPSSEEEWNGIQRAFEDMSGFPDVCGVIDGTLLEIIRFTTY